MHTEIQQDEKIYNFNLTDFSILVKRFLELGPPCFCGKKLRNSFELDFVSQNLYNSYHLDCLSVLAIKCDFLYLNKTSAYCKSGSSTGRWYPPLILKETSVVSLCFFQSSYCSDNWLLSFSDPYFCRIVSPQRRQLWWVSSGLGDSPRQERREKYRNLSAGADSTTVS